MNVELFSSQQPPRASLNWFALFLLKIIYIILHTIIHSWALFMCWSWSCVGFCMHSNTFFFNNSVTKSDKCINPYIHTYSIVDPSWLNMCFIFLSKDFFSDIVDIKPANMEDLTEVITAAEFHPHHCNLFVYSSSKGTLRLCDMREAALCDKHSKCEYTCWELRGTHLSPQLSKQVWFLLF